MICFVKLKYMGSCVPPTALGTLQERSTYGQPQMELPIHEVLVHTWG